MRHIYMTNLVEKTKKEKPKSIAKKEKPKNPKKNIKYKIYVLQNKVFGKASNS